MKKIIVSIVAIAVFATPCVYDILSQEPSPLVGLVATASQAR